MDGWMRRWRKEGGWERRWLGAAVSWHAPCLGTHDLLACLINNTTNRVNCFISHFFVFGIEVDDIQNHSILGSFTTLSNFFNIRKYQK